MTLDPIITAFMHEAAARAAALPPASSPAESRALLDAMGDELFQEVAEGIPEGVDVEDGTIPAHGDSPAVPIRIYRPAAVDPSGVHVLMHGGGWWQGSIRDWISDVQASERALAAGCTVVTVEYRLAPEHPYPAGLDDVATGVRWALAHADDFDTDTAGVSVGGVSAGANLTAAALLRLRDEGSPLPGFAVFEAGVFDLSLDYDSFRRYEAGFGLETAMMPGLVSMYLADPELVRDPFVSPVRAASFAGLPPSHFVTAEHDPTRDTSDAFADALEQAGVPVTRSLRLGHIHQSPVLTKVLPAAREWRADVTDALRLFHVGGGHGTA